MKKTLTLLVLFLFAGSFMAQEQILNSYDAAPADTNYWQYFENHGGQHYQTSESADSAEGWLNISYPTDNKYEGEASMQLEYSAHNIESYGGYTKLEHWNPDSNGVYDWSLYDTLSLWYNNVVPQSEIGRVHLRVNLHDVSDVATKTYDVTQVEYYYSFQYVLDDEPGWNEIKIPLVNNYDWDGNGFNLTGWSGIQGNQVLDLDQIKGYSLEFSINGGGEGDSVLGTVLLDKLALKGIAKRPQVFFNGAAVPSTMEMFAWNGSAEIVEGAGNNEESPNAIKWTQTDAWSGFGFNMDTNGVDLSFHWDIDTLKFKMKADAGTGNLRLQWEDGTAIIGTNFDPVADGEWHSYEFALADLVTYYDGTSDFNYEEVRVFQILTEGTGVSGNVIYVDDLWTGNPTFDVKPPDPPGLVAVAPGNYINLVTWGDVAGEADEVYDVYYSMNPITNLEDPYVEVVQKGIEEGTQVAEHTLRAPLEDTELTYYYAVVARDAAGNASELAGGDVSLSNTAKGVAVVSPEPPAEFNADGDLQEWAGIMPFRMFPEDGSGTIVTNQEIDGDEDLSVNAFVAVDEDYLYVAFDIQDDIVHIDSTMTTYLVDGADLFIGLYDWHGESHGGPQRGSEPDYQLRFVPHQLIVANLGDHVLMTHNSENYSWEPQFPTGYTVEARIPLTDLASVAEPDDDIFKPVVGMRTPIDFSINDADATGTREGILTYSPRNEDMSWSEVSRWSYTWIGDKMVDVEESEVTPKEYTLSQNYPNPFNPSTTIKYTLKEQTKVSLKVFNMLGQEVATLVNKEQTTGAYTINFSASQLASGVYIYQLNTGSFISAKKMMLIK